MAPQRVLDWLGDLATRERSVAYKILFTLAAFAAALALRLGVAEGLPPGFPYLTFFPAVIVTAFVCGPWAGSILAGACGIAAWYFFIGEPTTFELTPAGFLALAFYGFIVTTDILIIHAMNVSLAKLRVERERSRALAESRDTMFSELQHRISNNLAVVSSLLKLDRNTVADPGARAVLDKAATRLALISSLQRQLYDPNVQDFDLGIFLSELCRDVIESAGPAGDITYSVDAGPLRLQAERAVPLVLILAEMIANAVEHGFPEGEDGHIAVTVTTEDERFTVEVADNGVGVPANFNWEKGSDLGAKLVGRLARQLGGEIEVTPSAAGATFRLTAPIDPESAFA